MDCCLQEQYNVHSSARPSTSGIKNDPQESAPSFVSITSLMWSPPGCARGKHTSSGPPPATWSSFLTTSRASTSGSSASGACCAYTPAVHKKSANPPVYDLNPNLSIVDMMLMCAGGSMSVYMVIENFRNGDALPVYRRFRDRGRLAPAGLS